MLELSNRQLVFGLRKSPHCAVLTNILPNHLDDHGNVEAYIEAKYEIARYQDGDDLFLLNIDDPLSVLLSSRIPAQVSRYSLQQSFPTADYWTDRTFLYHREERMASLEDLRLLGEHNVLNALVAVAVACQNGAATPEIQETLRSFGGLEHRLEMVGRVNGIDFINDSAGTNPHNVDVAVRSVAERKHLIIGGTREGFVSGEFHPAAREILKSNVASIWLIGDMRHNIQAEFLSQGVPAELMHMAENMGLALEKAFAMAKSGDTIILAPGCVSFGEFRDYRERGLKFKELVAQFGKEQLSP